MKEFRVVVAHPGRQHSYRVAKALKCEGMLYKYVTTVYNKDSSLLMRIVKIFLNRDNYQRAQKRKCAGIEDNDVVQICEIEGLLLLALQRLDYTRYFVNKYQRYISNKFQKKLADFVISNNVDAVISYDTNSLLLFSILLQKAPNVTLIMDNAHPNRHYLYHSYHENWSCVGDFSRTLQPCGYIMNETDSAIFGEEAKKAHYHIVASSYSMKALEYDGIPAERIFKIPYGVDADRFVSSQRIYSRDRIQVLFVGEVNQRKGIRQVLDAAKMIDSPEVTFNIVGLGRELCSDLYEPYVQYVNFLGRLPYEELLNQFASSHLFVFPTMGEGFGLVLLEAMAAGLPVITTNNCAGSDIVTDGENGFIIPVGDTEQLVNKIMWCKIHPEELSRMSKKAVAISHDYTWERYEKGIRECIYTIENSKDGNHK